MRIIERDPALAHEAGAAVVVGKAFAFIGRDAFKRPSLAWVARLAGTTAARVVPLLGPDPVPLPGATLAPAAVPALVLASVTSDKALYREGRDEVHLLALDPLDPSAAAVLEISLNGAEYEKRPVELDARGAAAVTLRDLPAGEIEVRFRGAPKEAPACTFTVAAYRLAPLVASLADRRLTGDRLALTIRVESFGSPVEGAVQLELTDRGARKARVTAEARGGVVEAAFTLTGEGPHSINVQLVADPSRTATVPIVGSRAAERSLTTFSPLGHEIQGSLLPGEGSTPVRGVFLSEGAVRTTPFRLDRVDTARARLTAMVPVEGAVVVVIDPTFPQRRPGAVDPDKAPHPAASDDRYRRGEAAFQAGQHAAARALFEEALRSAASPHPNYAYYVACCHAGEGSRVRAVAALRRAIADGWRDFDLLATDPDLAALREYPPYEALRTRGLREIALGDLAAGEVVEVDVPAPMGILALGAFLSGVPWEGWATTITPSALAPSIVVPQRATPGAAAVVAVETGRAGDDVSVYLVVKDGRLLTPDTPESRLAGGIKAVAEGAARALAEGRPTETLAQLARPPMPPPMPYAVFGAPPGMGMPQDGAVFVAASMAGAPTGESFGPPPPVRAMAPRSPGSAGSRPRMAAPPPPPAARLPKEAAPGAPPPPQAGGSGPYRESPPPPPPSVEEPEVLFAGLVATQGGRASVSLRLGPDFADYVVEAFAVAGTDWAPASGRFRAEKEIFATLDVPAFVHPADGAVGRLHAGTRSGGRVRVTRDGNEVRLLSGGRALAPGERLGPGRVELSFLAGPGAYEATLEDDSGAVERTAREVQTPGLLRSLARSVRFLEPGQALSRDDDPSILALRVLPGLDKPFSALVDATAHYGHACCEQTAAKMMAACAMFALAAEDRARRDRAEAILLTGVRRMATMWLRGRGFKMYPESPPSPDTYWGPKAAQYLWNLGLLRDLAPSRALDDALREGLAMAEDATAAYDLAWPPTTPTTCAEAYAALRFGKADGAALSVVQRLVPADGSLPQVPPSPYGGGAVAMRSEGAYGAAVLLRAGGASERQRALALANAVIASIGPGGGLYSTVDSVAAIALLSELSAAKILGGAGEVEVDGKPLSHVEAVAHAGEIRSLRAVSGVTAVEITRMVEERWERFQGGLPIAVRLQKGTATTRRFEALDPVELEVTLEGGYKPGDLLWVCLPDALSRVVGGGQVKRFAVDFAGQSQVKVSLAATGVTLGPDGAPAPARFAVCVRNMFEEERGGNPGVLEVTVAPRPAAGCSPRCSAGSGGCSGARDQRGRVPNTGHPISVRKSAPSAAVRPSTR
jgi:hypothetical protein